MLDRPIPFNERLRATWPVGQTTNVAIDHMLHVLASTPRGSQRTTRTDDKDVSSSDAHGQRCVGPLVSPRV